VTVQRVLRASVRILLVDPAGRILLLHARDPGRPDLGGWWFTVGGGIDAGEDPVTAAVREITEETGLRVDPAAVGPVVWRGRAVFPWLGRLYDQTEEYRLVRCPSFVPDPADLQPDERLVVCGSRWCSVEDLLALDPATDPVRPARLAELLPRVLAGAWEGEPQLLGTTTDVA
jgi:8-oxo-dGTP pyrophosphatase MutT (NUDIX family)